MPTAIAMFCRMTRTVRRASRTAAGQAPHADQHASSHVHRVEAEQLLSRFRDEVRAELRRADAAGQVERLTVDTLRTVLDTALAAVRSTLR